MEKKGVSPCSFLFAIVVLGFVIFQAYKIVQFFQTPYAMQRLIDDLKALGLCLGIVVLGFALLIALTSVKNKKPRLSSLSKTYPVRCIPVEMERTTDTRNSGEVRESHGPEPIYPIYLLLSITNYGISLTAIPSQFAWDCISANNENLYRALSGDRPGPIILPMGYFFLYYVPYRQSDGPKSEVYPSSQAGCSGSLPADLSNTNVEIAIVYNGIMQEGNLNQIYPRERSLKLMLVALNHEAHDDPAATREIYDAIFGMVQVRFTLSSCTIPRLGGHGVETHGIWRVLAQNWPSQAHGEKEFVSRTVRSANLTSWVSEPCPIFEFMNPPDSGDDGYY